MKEENKISSATTLSAGQEAAVSIQGSLSNAVPVIEAKPQIVETKEKSTSIREKIENNLSVFFLGVLLTGFLAGLATFKGHLEMSGLETISKDRLKILESSQSIQPQSGMQAQNVPLPKSLTPKEINKILAELSSAYNSQNIEAAYNILGPLGKAQTVKDQAAMYLRYTHDLLGNYKEGTYLFYNFMGQQGPYKMFMLNCMAKYEKEERGAVSILVIDDGEAYQIINANFTKRS